MELQWANPDGYNYPDRLERALRWFTDHGFVQRPPRLDGAIDQSYVDYAIGRLGRYRAGCGANPCQ